MVKKLKTHLTLTLIFLVMTLGQQVLFYVLKGMPNVWLPIGKYFGIFAFFFAATFIKSFFLRYFFLSFVLILNFFQMAHLSYFGTQILPGEIYLLFSQLHEIQGVLWVEYQHVFLPLVFTVIPGALGYFALRKFKTSFESKVIGILFCIYLVYNPIRTLVTGNTWGRQPSTRELAGMNVYLAFSYFSGKILPHKLLSNKTDTALNSSTKLVLTKSEDSSWDKVIFVLGESLTPHHMSLFGYEKPTTPFLVEQKNDPNFFHTIGLSSGVSTDISVAFFLNLGFGEAGGLKAAKGQHCLFKLAKEKEFKTHFLSIQSAQQLRYISPYLCSSSLDDYRSLEDISPQTLDHQAADDKDLLPHLEKVVLEDSKNFIILHQRGSHGPWEMRSQVKNRRFPHTDKVNHYNNSIVEFDLFFKELSNVLKKSDKKILVVYASDHGEAMGQDGKWGHGQLIRPAFEIPVLMKSFNKELPPLTKSIPKFIPHYNIALYLAQEIGHQPNQEITTPPKDFVIFGNDIDGFSGKSEILFNPNGTYDFKVIP